MNILSIPDIFGNQMNIAFRIVQSGTLLIRWINYNHKKLQPLFNVGELFCPYANFNGVSIQFKNVQQ